MLDNPEKSKFRQQELRKGHPHLPAKCDIMGRFSISPREFVPIPPPNRRAHAVCVVAAMLYGFAVWTVLVLGMGGRACTVAFSWSAAFTWWQIYTVFGVIYWVPIVAVTGGLVYAGARRTALAGRPVRVGIAALSILAGIFAAAALLTPPNQHCVYL